MEKVRRVIKDPKSMMNGRTKFTTNPPSVTTLMRNLGDLAKDGMDKERDDAKKIVGIIFA